MSTLIKNGRIVTAVDDYNADIFIEDEKISHIGNSLQMDADKVINASNRLVFREESILTPISTCRLGEP